mgnify:CR=1 FL=1
MKAIRPLYIVRLPWLNALIPMCLLLGSILPTSVLAQEVTRHVQDAEASFARHDRDGNGLLELGEFRALVRGGVARFEFDAAYRQTSQQVLPLENKAQYFHF